MQRRTWTLLALGIAGLAAVAVAVGVYAQPGPPAGGAPGAPGGFGGRGDFMAMMGRMGGGVAIAVAGDSVYVVYMGTLFKFNADTLEEEAQVPLRPAQLVRPGGAPGAAPGAAPAAPGAMQ